jgi:hypothetical protein
MTIKVPYIVGYASFKSNLPIEEVGEILSDKIFGGLQFGGKELNICEEVPAIFIQSPIMGLQIVLQGYSGLLGNNHFDLSIIPLIELSGIEFEQVKIDIYLIELLRTSLEGIEDIVILEE